MNVWWFEIDMLYLLESSSQMLYYLQVFCFRLRKKKVLKRPETSYNNTKINVKEPQDLQGPET